MSAPSGEQTLIASSASRSPALCFETASASKRTEAFRAGIEINVFTHLASCPQTAAELAGACLAWLRGIRILADYLTVFEFLGKQGDRYVLTADTNAFLNRKSPDYLGDALDYLAAPKLRACFESLPVAVRRGGTAFSDEGTVSRDNPIWVTFAQVVAPAMRLPAQLLSRLIRANRNQRLRVLDVTAEHGRFGVTVAQRYPAATPSRTAFSATTASTFSQARWCLYVRGVPRNTVASWVRAKRVPSPPTCQSTGRPGAQGMTSRARSTQQGGRGMETSIVTSKR